jgi:hypothetical protein
MAANLTRHIPMIPLLDYTDSSPFTQSQPEKASQTFLIGVPVQLNAGFVQKWDGSTFNGGLLGISLIAGSNLASNGAGAPAPFGQIGPPGAIQTYGSVINEPNAVNIAVGTPITDGRTLYTQANAAQVFEGQVDNSAGAVPADYTPTQAQVGSLFGITFDSTGSAYVDLGKLTPGTNTCVQLVGLSPVDGSIVNARVRFVFTAQAKQITGM